jgi:hypothetical protein
LLRFVLGAIFVLAQSNAQAVYMANQTNKDAQETASLRNWLSLTAAFGLATALEKTRGAYDQSLQAEVPHAAIVLVCAAAFFKRY